jgi:hypothetical protein
MGKVKIVTSYGDEGFSEIGGSEGMLRAEVEGQHQEAAYKARNFINRGGTIGYSEVDANQIKGFLFISKTGSGDVMTIPGQGTGPIPFEVEGMHAIMTVEEGGTVEEFYATHMQALKSTSPIADEAWLRQELLSLPQRAVDIAIKLFSVVVDSMDEAMDGFAEAMGGEVEDVKITRSCPGCGAETSDTDRTCPKCGKELD